MNDTNNLSGEPRNDAPLIDFMERFVDSRQFQQVFEEGMRLVEETADYLDGEGREQARAMSRDAAMTYATESMRLTTRLMQMASWLLLQRAVAAGELSEQDARKEQESIDLTALAREPQPRDIERMPPQLADLVRRGSELYARIVKLDEMIHRRAAPLQTNPLHSMLGRIESAFGAREGESRQGAAGDVASDTPDGNERKP